MIYCIKGFFEVNVDAKNKMSLVKCIIDYSVTPIRAWEVE